MNERQGKLVDAVRSDGARKAVDLTAEFKRDWLAFCDADPVALDFTERMEQAGLITFRSVKRVDVEQDPFASERGIELGGTIWVLTEAGRAALNATPLSHPAHPCENGCQYAKDVGMWPEHSCVKCQYELIHLVPQSQQGEVSALPQSAASGGDGLTPGGASS